MLTFLASPSEPASVSALVLVFYLVTILAAVAGLIFGVARWSSARRKEIQDATLKAQDQAVALAQNTSAAAANTAAIQRLSEKLDQFLEESRREQQIMAGQIHEHGQRLGRLER
jgi:hypothetical protein